MRILFLVGRVAFPDHLRRSALRRITWRQEVVGCQRDVMIARIIQNGAVVLLRDEPTGPTFFPGILPAVRGGKSRTRDPGDNGLTAEFLDN